ncbi:MAG TPA: hypothetical protein PLV39_14020 [Fimbriimonadaceae bacterium]|nr:hypothetical protein [Fimbriimonadaceae bacterium]
MALNLQACVDVRFDSKINRFTGGNQLTFTEDVHDGAKEPEPMNHRRRVPARVGHASAARARHRAERDARSAL